MYEYDAGGAVLDLAWSVAPAPTSAPDAPRAVQRLAVSQADKHVGVVDLTASL